MIPLKAIDAGKRNERGGVEPEPLRLAGDRTTPLIGATSNAPQAQRWAFVLFMLGLSVRVVYYLLRFPLRGDEARLAIHFVETSYSQLAHPLEHTRIEPGPFLWMQVTFVRL